MDYELLTESTGADYVATRPELAELVDSSMLDVREIGDGNLNLIFVCRDAAGASLVLKQSLPYVRIVGPSWPLTADRSTSEWIGLSEAAAASPSTSPAVFGYDENQHVVAMEDLSRLVVWRSSLDGGASAPGAEEQCGRHVARLACATSVIGRTAEDFRATVARATNPDLCRITEDLVFTEPLIDHEHNVVSVEVSPVVANLRSDDRLRAEVSRLKAEFMTRTEVLVHGDLHTGSVMVGPSADAEAPEIKVIDAEFCCYGPVAFDLGMLMANGLFALARARVLARRDQATWLESFADNVWTSFVDEFWKLWPQRLDRSFDDEAARGWLKRVERDAIGFAGCEAIRRIVGFAKVSDIESLPQEEHVVAASVVLKTAHRLLVDPPGAVDSDLFAAELA